VRSEDVLNAICRHHRDAAIVAEVVIDDKEWLDFPRGERPCRQRRIDALMVKGKQRTAIEIKVSRSDYLRESDRKRRPWVAVCHRFVYATPAGLITPQEVPPGIGLWEVAADGRVEIVKRAMINREPGPVPDQLFVAMCYRAARRDLFERSAS
jgi:hypothetical protein